MATSTRIFSINAIEIKDSKKIFKVPYATYYNPI